VALALGERTPGRQDAKKERKQKHCSTSGSHVIPQRSTGEAQPNLTSVIGREPVCCGWYGHEIQTSCSHSSWIQTWTWDSDLLLYTSWIQTCTWIQTSLTAAYQVAFQAQYVRMLRR